MKRILYIFLLILISFNGLYKAQSTYKLRIYNYNFSAWTDDGRCGTNELWVDVRFSDNSTTTIHSNYPNSYSASELLNQEFNKRITQVIFHVFIHEKGGFPADCNGDTAHLDLANNIPSSGCESSGHMQGNHSDGDASVSISFDYEVSPVIKVKTPTSALIGYNDGFKLLVDNSSVNYPVSSYRYQYQIVNVGDPLNQNNWQDLPPQYQSQESPMIDLSSFLPNTVVGKRIWFRAISPCGGTYASDSVMYEILHSAPHILTSNITPNLCSYGETGTATLNFDRTLIAGETLQIGLENTVTGASVFNGYITNDLQTSTSYTLQNLPPGTYKLDILGTYNGNATYTDSPTHTINFEITKPTPVTFDMTSKTDVYCFQGSDGIINLTAGGGQNQYQYLVTKDGQPFLDWTNFSNGNNTAIQNLSAGIYKIKVRDSNLCIAKDPTNSSVEKEITVTITQPSAAIALPTADIEIVRPLGYGLSDGYISVRVTGGTPNADGSYNFEWRKDAPNGNIISTGITTDAVNNPYTIKLANLPAGTYYLTVKDKNYAGASSQLGNCGIISQEFIVLQTEPLVATIEIEKQISCNLANDYPNKLDLDNNGVPDEAEDGKLKAMVTGGVGTYSYQWQILNNGTFQDITGATQQILSNQSVGTYKVLVHDVNNNTTDASYTFTFPAELEVTTSANTISCYNQNSGIVSANATGGTGILGYQWSSGATTSIVTGLSGGNYLVLVTDSKNCKVQKSAQVIQPDQIIITDVLVQNPICFGASNGEIKTTISGGKAPYSISWSNGITGSDNLNIPAGTYTMTITDANGCSLSKSYTLTNPVQLTVDLGADVTLCLGDTQTYNVAINDAGATYQWKDQNGNMIGTSASITLSAAGTYSVLITDSKGCTATDSVKIKNSSEVLNPQFMLATHAYTEASVVLVNTSPTQPQAVEWIIPTGNTIQVIQKTNDLLELKFLTTGSYEIGLKGIQGECVKTFYKTVVVEENTSGVNLNPAKASNITEFTILPNPNNGVFKVLVGLGIEKPIKIRILDMVSHEVFPAVSQPKATYFVVPFNTTLPSGTYLVILETGDEAMVKRIIVQ